MKNVVGKRSSNLYVPGGRLIDASLLVSGDGISIVGPDSEGKVTISIAPSSKGLKGVANFSALPDPALHADETYLVLQPQGVIWVNRKQAGLYSSDGAVWTYEGDSTELYFPTPP